MIVSNSFTIQGNSNQINRTVTAGETHQGKILGKLSPDTYSANLYGKEIHLKTTENLPLGSRISFVIDQIQEATPPLIGVKDVQILMATEDNASSEPSNQATQDLADDDSDLGRILNLLKSRNIPITKETIALASKFADSPGILAQKYATFQSLINKGIPLNETNLAAVHRALHDENPLALADTQKDFLPQQLAAVKDIKSYLSNIQGALTQLDYEIHFKSADIQSVLSDKSAPLEMVKLKATEFFDSQAQLSPAVKSLYNKAIDASHSNGDVRQILARFDNYQKNLISLQLSSNLDQHISEISTAKSILSNTAKMDFVSVDAALSHIHSQASQASLTGSMQSNMDSALQTALSKAKNFETLNVGADVTNHAIREGLHKVIDSLETLGYEKPQEAMNLTAADKVEVQYNKLQSLVENASNPVFLKEALGNALSQDMPQSAEFSKSIQSAMDEYASLKESPHDEDFQNKLADIKKQLTATKDISQAIDQIKSRILEPAACPLSDEEKILAEAQLKKAENLNQLGLKNQALPHVEKTIELIAQALKEVSKVSPLKPIPTETSIRNSLDGLSKLLDLNRQFNQSLTTVPGNEAISAKVTAAIEGLNQKLNQIGQMNLSSDILINKMSEEIKLTQATIESIASGAQLGHSALDALEQFKQDMVSTGKLPDFPNIDMSTLSPAEAKMITELKTNYDAAKLAYDSGLTFSSLTQFQKLLSDAMSQLSTGDLDSISDDFMALKDQLLQLIGEEKEAMLDQLKPSATLAPENEFLDALAQLKSSVKHPVQVAQWMQNIEKSALPESIKSELFKSLEDVKKLQMMGNGQRATGKLANDIQRMIDHQKEIHAPQKEESVSQSKALMEHPELESLLKPLDIGTKDFLVTTITKRMQDAESSFNQLKRDISRNLDSIIKLTEPAKGNVFGQVRDALDKSIQTLDKAILKSDVLLFTDMQTERKLLGLSSQLQTARAHLGKGDNEAATKILKSVQKEFDKMQFKPSSTKAMHMVVGEKEILKRQNLNTLVEKELIYNVNKASIEKPSAKNVFDLLRESGLNYENDVAHKLLKQDTYSAKESFENNLKHGLLKYLENGPEGAKEALVKVLESVHGQQLLNKADPDPNHQSMFFNIPFTAGEDPTDLKVFVNSRKNGDKIDWQNTSLYFLLETKKLGKTGIHVSVSDKVVNFIIKSNHPLMKALGESYKPQLKNNLESVGFKMSGLKFEPFKSPVESESEDKSIESPTAIAVGSNQGVDVKI